MNTNTTLKIGQKINDFEIKKFLKSSDYNKTESYLVANEDDRKGILKLYLNNDDDDEPFEKQMCKNFVGCDSLPQLLESGIISIDDKVYHYTIMECIDGELLHECIILQKYNTWKTAQPIIVGLLNALKYLHSMSTPIIHNRIRHTSVIIREEKDNVKAYLVGTSHLSHRVNGRPRFDAKELDNWFRAPETLKGMYDERSDIFSAGALLYTMIEGKEPWNIDKLLFCSRLEKPQIKRLRMEKKNIVEDMNLSEAQKRILGKMLALDYDNRYKNVDEVLKDMKNCDIEGNEGETTLEQEKEKPVSDKKKEKARSKEKKIPVVAGNGFADVAGLDDVKQMLYDDVIFVLKNLDKVEKYKLKLPNGVLFYGPPGCGKTFVAEKFAQESKLNFMMVKASDIGSIYIHGTQGKIAELFDEAAKKSPTVLCFDELDGMVPNRSKVHHEAISGEVNEFLSQLNNCSERGIFVIGTTNRPELIDSAVLRSGRLDKKIYIPLPDEMSRQQLFRINLRERYCDESIDYAELANLSNGYVASDIAFIVDQTALQAAKKDVPISQQMILDMLAKVKQSLSKEEINEYESMKNRFENRISEKKTNRIGFRY